MELTVAAHCKHLCHTHVARSIRAMMIWRVPSLPPYIIRVFLISFWETKFLWKSNYNNKRYYKSLGKGFATFSEVNLNSLTPRAYDNHATPASIKFKNILGFLSDFNSSIDIFIEELPYLFHFHHSCLFTFLFALACFALACFALA